MAHPVRREDPILKPVFFRNGVYEDVSYDGMNITSTVLASFIQQVRERLETESIPQEEIS